VFGKVYERSLHFEAKAIKRSYMLGTLHSGWYDDLISLVESAQRRLVIAAPFITNEGAQLVSRAVGPSLRASGRIEILTDLSPVHVAQGSLVPAAVLSLYQSAVGSFLWHIPRLHAKVYIADDTRAIVTSANLTAGAFYRNLEYGLQVDDQAVVASIQSHFDDFRAAGTPVALDDLLAYAQIATQVCAATERQSQNVDPRLKQALQTLLGDADEHLIRLRLRGGAVHGVFAKTIHYLLLKYGPLPTTRLHALIKALHPDLCDDSVDRVIDGEHYGKKWKHAVRTAQQQLKRNGVVEFRQPLWRIISRGRP
jgi:hypothetical protein